MGIGQSQKRRQVMFQWFVDICNSINANIELLTTTLGSLLIAWGILRKVKKKAEDAHNEFSQLFALPAKVDAIQKELVTNGGKSLKDSLNRIEMRQCRAEEKMRILLSGADKPCFECNEQGECIYINNAYLNLVECKEADALLNNWRNLIHPDDRDEIIKEWSMAVKDKRDFEYKFRYLTKSDKVVAVYCKAQLMHDHKGNISGWFGTLKEIPNLPNEWTN